MTINVYGVPPNITAQKWSELFFHAFEGGAGEVVSEGFAVTPADGTRKVSVSPGKIAAAGVLVESDATETVTLPDAGGDNSFRLDAICLQIDWTGTQTSAGTVMAQSVNIPFWLGGLTRDAGTKWQVPLALVFLSGSTVQLTNDDITDIRPTRRESKVYHVGVTNNVTATGGQGRVKIGERAIPNPGFDYRLRISAAVNMDAVSAGHGNVDLELTTSTNLFGSPIEHLDQVRAPDKNAGPAVLPAYTTGRQFGPSTVTLYMSASPAVPNGEQFKSSSTNSSFHVVVEPW